MDRPIIFSGAMVRALLDGRKTQTRRLIKDDVRDPPGMDAVHPKNTIKHPAPYLDSYCGDPRTSANPRGMSDRWCWWTRDDRQCLPTFRVPFIPGDRLYVREAWAPLDALTHSDPGTRALVDRGFYRADDGTVPGEIKRWRPSIHMPRWASRLTLMVTEVRVERLHDISEDDARAEGAKRHVPCKSSVSGTTVASDTWHYDEDMDGRLYEGRTAQEAFEILWGKINGWKSWDANPWVVAITFEVINANIDARPQVTAARSAETSGLGPQGNGPVGSADAPSPHPLTAPDPIKES